MLENGLNIQKMWDYSGEFCNNMHIFDGRMFQEECLITLVPNVIPFGTTINSDAGEI